MRNDQNTTELYRIVKPRWRKANITVRSLGTKKSNSAEPNLLMRLLYDISYTGRQRVKSRMLGRGGSGVCWIIVIVGAIRFLYPDGKIEVCFKRSPSLSWDARNLEREDFTGVGEIIVFGVNLPEGRFFVSPLINIFLSVI